MAATSSSIATAPPADAPLFTSAARVCAVCTREYSRYKCPRCAIAYCGLDCYRAHGERCTEGFYKEQAERELRATRASESERADMADKLRRFEAEYGEWDGDAAGGVRDVMAAARAAGRANRGLAADDDDASASGEDGDGAGSDGPIINEQDAAEASRLGELLESGASLTEESLSSAQRAQFRRALADGSLAASLQGAPAWWERLPAHALQPTRAGWAYADDAAASAAAAAGAPPIAESITPVTALTKRPVAASTRHAALEQLLSCVYTTRLFCAAPLDDPAAAAAALLDLSASLSGDAPAGHPSAEHALISFRERCEGRPAVTTSAAFGAACVADAALVGADPGVLALAMSAISQILHAACRAARAKGSTSKGGDVGVGAEAGDSGRRRLQLARRKADFMQSWWASLGNPERREICDAFVFALRVEADTRATLARAAGGAEAEAAAAAAARTRPGRRLIEEL